MDNDPRAKGAAAQPGPGARVACQGRYAFSIIWGAGGPACAARAPAYLNAPFPNAMGVREVPGDMLFFPEEFPGLIAEEAKRLWDIA